MEIDIKIDRHTKGHKQMQGRGDYQRTSHYWLLVPIGLGRAIIDLYACTCISRILCLLILFILFGDKPLLLIGTNKTTFIANTVHTLK